jgi:hypothetical protein
MCWRSADIGDTCQKFGGIFRRYITQNWLRAASFGPWVEPDPRGPIQTTKRNEYVCRAYLSIKLLLR